MKIRVGKYELNTAESFNSQKEAVELFMEIFPDATKSDVEKEVKSVFKSQGYGSNQSGNAAVENTESEASDSKPRKRAVGKEQTRKD